MRFLECARAGQSESTTVDTPLFSLPRPYENIIQPPGKITPHLILDNHYILGAIVSFSVDVVTWNQCQKKKKAPTIFLLNQSLSAQIV